MKYKHKTTGKVINEAEYSFLSYLQQEEYEYYNESSLLDDIIDIGITTAIFGSIGSDNTINITTGISGNIEGDSGIDFGGGSFGGAGAGGDW